MVRRQVTAVTANIGATSGPNHDTLLHVASERKIDVIMIQEPYAKRIEGRDVTKTHPRYNLFAPHENWDGPMGPPRVLTYVRKDLKLKTKQLRPAASPCLL